MSLENLMQAVKDLVITYGPDLLLAIATLFIGLWVIKMLNRVFRKVLERGNVDESLKKFLLSLSKTLLKVMLFISVASMVGIATTSFIAVLGAAGLAVGLALQGGLANFAGGVIILMLKPFKVGDFIEAQGVSGTVKDIQIFHTCLATPDNKKIVVPNGSLSNGIITNFSAEEKRRIDMVFGIGYDDDIKNAKDILKRLVSADERILKDPEPVIVVSELADSSVNFTVRVWCLASDYWGIYFDMHEKVKMTFDENKISIPFPQRDIHIYQN